MADNKNERDSAMLKKLLGRLNAKHDPAKRRRDRATVLLAYLEANHSLALDHEGLAKIGMNRKQAFQTVYDLVLHESVQMRADADGLVVVMTNDEFIRQMEARAKETWKEEAKLVLNGDQGAFDLAFAAESADAPENLSGPRQTLPDRRRDPWIELESFNLEID